MDFWNNIINPNKIGGKEPDTIDQNTNIDMDTSTISRRKPRKLSSAAKARIRKQRQIAKSSYKNRSKK